MSEIDVVLPCKLGCTRTEEDHEIPLPGVHNGYCARCFGTIQSGLEVSGSLVHHLLYQVPSALRSKKGNLGNMRTKGDSAPLPFDASAMDDANKVFRILSFWTSRLRLDIPVVGAWRNSRGEVVGLPFSATPESARILTRTLTHGVGARFEEWLSFAATEDVKQFKADMNVIRRTNLKWPTEDKPSFSRTTICPLDGERVIIVPPREPNQDRVFVCSKCGNILTEAEHEQYGRYLKAVVKS